MAREVPGPTDFSYCDFEETGTVTASGTSYGSITIKLGQPGCFGTFTAGRNYWRFGTPVSGVKIIARSVLPGGSQFQRSVCFAIHIQMPVA